MTDRTIAKSDESGCDWHELRRCYLRALDSRRHWIEVWHMVASNGLYKLELERCARLAIARVNGPQDWEGDVRHDALLILARRLKTSIDLGYDRSRPESHFDRWIRRIMMRHCQEAVRRMRRPLREGWRLDGNGESVPASGSDYIELRIDVSLAIERIADPARTILLLYGYGFSITEIAERLQMTYSQVQYARRKGLNRLKAQLGPEYNRTTPRNRGDAMHHSLIEIELEIDENK